MPLFVHLFAWEHGLVSVWHDLPMKFALHSQIYFCICGSNLQMPWLEQFNKHEFISTFDWSMFSNCCKSSRTRSFTFANDAVKGQVVAYFFEEIKKALKFLRPHRIFPKNIKRPETLQKSLQIIQKSPD